MFINDLDPDLHPWLTEDIWSKRMRLTWKRAAKKHWVLSNKKWWVLYEAQADADRRLELLNRVDTMWQGGLTEEQGRKLCDELRKELADA